MNWSTPEFAAVAALLARTSGLNFPTSRITFAEAGLRRAMARAREPHAGAFLRRLEREPELLQAALAEVIVGETYFFRDPAQFDLIRTRVLPEIAGRVAEPLRIWSAGCSTGEEAYSLAMLLETSAALEGARILGTDLSAASIDAARRGSYPARSFRDGVHPWRDGCFTASGNRWQIDDRFRRRVTFATHNLAAADSPAACGAEPFDLIVCRNVLIYLDEATIVRAAATLLEGLAPGGWLLTGPTDPILPLGPGLLAVTTPAGIAYRRDARRSPAIAPPPVRPRPAPRRRVTASVATLPRPRDFAAADAYVADALRLLDAGNLGEALVAARRARYIDRSSVVAHVVLGRAFRLCGRPDAARRSLRRSRTLLAAHAPEAPVRGAGGVRAGALAAVVAAELSQLARTAALRP